MAKILVVEDDEDIRNLLVDTLLDNGHDVIEAGDGGAGLEKVSLEHPDIVLLDMMMPVMDGMQVLERIKNDPSTRLTPVIMVSAKGQEQDVLKALRFGARHYLTKPWDPDELDSKINDVLSEASNPV